MVQATMTMANFVYGEFQECIARIAGHRNPDQYLALGVEVSQLVEEFIMKKVPLRQMEGRAGDYPHLKDVIVIVTCTDIRGSVVECSRKSCNAAGERTELAAAAGARAPPRASRVQDA